MINVEKNEIEICGDAEELGTDLLIANMVVYKKNKRVCAKKECSRNIKRTFRNGN